MDSADSTPRRRSGKTIALLAAVCVLAAGGGTFAAVSAGSAHANVPSESAAPQRTTPGLAVPVVAPLQLLTTPTDGASQVNPAAPVILKATNGKILRASLTSSDGKSVEGAVNAAGDTWTSSGALSFNTAYSANYVAKDGAGRESTITRSFSTVSTANEADAAMYPLDTMTVGVAQPIQLTFSEPVTNKAAVEKAIKITSTSGQVGKFRWYSDTMVRYRPETFWTAKSTITVDIKLFGVSFGNGQVGNFNKTNTIHIGEKKVAVADAVAKTFTASINDKQVGKWSVTMGDERFPSARGYLVLMDKQRKAHFVASSIGLKPGDPAYYGELDVQYATRLTPSGEFIHQATDSALPYIGVTNLSHGCIGMGPSGAAWVFNNMGVGDVVKVVNTKGDFANYDDGYGDWNIAWASYAKR
ncbi:Ig-like domain-containing protein [Pseudarthrobacter sp. J1738]|uniref:L,D-transpeptidase n=1 Tax=unclassified Pseudarthrobacter TaxID=2647000 RepID=UPI003D2B78F4